MIRKNHFKIAFAVLVFAKAVCISVVFSEEKIIELEELKTTLNASLLNNERMTKEITNLEKVNSNLRSSLMAANAEAVDFRKSYSKMRLQLEAYGIESVTDGRTGIEARLIKAMNEIRLLEEEKMGLSEALINLSDGSLKFIKLAEESSLDNEVIDETRELVDEADKALGIGSVIVSDKNTKGTIHEAGIIGVKDDYGIVVINVGSNSGAKIGMPFRLFRKDRPLGASVIVDVRDNVSAALIKNLREEEDYPKVGDLASVDTTKN
jgi:hypothetical protein